MSEEIIAIAGLAAVAAAMIAYVVLIIAAVIGIISARLTGGMKLVWCVLVFLAPFVGSILWFLVGRNNVQPAMYHYH
ncbi:uncharacterized protein DUF2545 [Murinocardiopsis flavida]|uniref:Uncharacterized protein DUF2545 n=1 Tax=Murinocardiopsis flavida TaxID=645275 RepID=A0A2P8CSY3_9ACTN|nr:PLD nuclease N-terminal domain-containing protein [Murinocardiopsis flavida]PSK88057.1 uncharacterized protein DUF2545 [Murinocardiopsis flavida]